MQTGSRPAIIRGDDAARGRWPWQVSIQASGSHFCGGVLINDVTVLSASHCFDFWIDPESLRVRLGSIFWNGSDPDAVERRIARIHMHPDYSLFEGLNDIAVVILSEPVPFNDVIRPICLQSGNEKEAKNRQCWVSGWGAAGARHLSFSVNFDFLAIV